MHTRRRGGEARLVDVSSRGRHARGRRRAGHREEGWAQNAVVHDLGTLRLGEHKPHDRECLERVVEGEPVQHEAHKRLDKVEETEHNPVREPLDVVLRLGRLKRIQREVHGNEETNEVGQETGEAEGKSSSSHIHVEENQLAHVSTLIYVRSSESRDPSRRCRTWARGGACQSG